ncbi:hypothetical protein N7457_008405 [Penicillium paradoxum]|uniref:uncharacterized protein n=1 Tax=Penicillium paradoxum TaxID=176176 RepID=UPI002546DD1D|nr:uncharacterized protein N7457_008405 [Penicillium paradoxum]KAJ5773509.1 hypothetical protein N7457_008405 [Penicillium paradoxum]
MKSRDDIGLVTGAGGAGTVAATPLQNDAATTYFFTFGDSYTQTEFSIDGTQPSAENPIGNPTLGTGTTSGGTNYVGYLTTLYNTSPVLSYNFAVGGATIDNRIVDTKVKDVTTQVGEFELAYGKRPASTPWTSENAVFGFWIGINDIGWGYSGTQPGVLVPTLMAQYKFLIERLYAAGGRKFLFLNVPPTNRTPMIIKEGPDAVKTYTTWVKAYNDGLESMIDDFESTHTGTTIVRYDTWSFMPKILDDPQAYGFPNATCYNENGTSCIWWNHYHPGQNYHKLQAADMKQYLQPLGAW